MRGPIPHGAKETAESQEVRAAVPCHWQWVVWQWVVWHHAISATDSSIVPFTIDSAKPGGGNGEETGQW